MMKMNHVHWLRRILACMAVFCLTVTTFGVQPAQASPPAGDYITSITFISVSGPKDPICIGKLVELVIGVKLTYIRDPKDPYDVELAPLCTPDNPNCRMPEDHGAERKGGLIGAVAELSVITPRKYDLPPMWAGREVGAANSKWT